MKNTFLNLAGAATLATGMLFAQTTAPAPNQPNAGAATHQHWQHQRGDMLQRLSTDLNLTPAQKTQAQSIFSNMRQQSQPVVQQLKQDKQALAAAVKSNAPASEIDRLANKMGPLEAQMTAMHAKAFVQFRKTLTPDQTAKLDSMTNRHMSRNFKHQGKPAPGQKSE